MLEKWFDVDKLIRYVVVDRAMKNDDGIFHMYCSGDDACLPHNFLWYELKADPDTERIILIPWDLDNAFLNLLVCDPREQFTAVEGDYNTEYENCEAYYNPPYYVQERSAICDPLLSSLKYYDDEY